MRTPDERAAERAKHKMVKWPGYYYHDPQDEVCDGCSWWQDDSIRVDYPCPIIIAMDETDEALAEVERLRGIIDEARTTLEAGHTAAYDLRNDLSDVLSRVSKVEEGT